MRDHFQNLAFWLVTPEHMTDRKLQICVCISIMLGGIIYEILLPTPNEFLCNWLFISLLSLVGIHHGFRYAADAQEAKVAVAVAANQSPPSS